LPEGIIIIIIITTTTTTIIIRTETNSKCRLCKHFDELSGTHQQAKYWQKSGT
jgi:hypothetical protein